jgi:hypothetical protein
LVTGYFFDPEGGETTATGTAVVQADGEFPEVLDVTVELREVGEASYSAPQATNYRLEIVGDRRVRFRMDSISLSTMLIGEGTFTNRALVLGYRSHDRRYAGFESFVYSDDNTIMACGCFAADGVTVKTWEVLMEPVAQSG